MPSKKPDPGVMKESWGLDGHANITSPDLRESCGRALPGK